MFSRRVREALAVLPHLARLLYLQCLAPRKDCHNKVGENAPVEWQLLADELSVSGCQCKKIVSVRMVRRASEQLEKAGLVARCTQKNRLSFVFLMPESGTKVTSKTQEGRLSVKVLDTHERYLSPCNTKSEAKKENMDGQACGQVSGQAPYIDIYIKKNIIRECVFDPERAKQIFQYWVTEGVLSVTELNNYVTGYFDFCQKRNATPNPEGLKNLLHSKVFFKQQRMANQDTASKVYEAKRMKQRAIARREEDIADLIDSNNIARRNR